MLSSVFGSGILDLGDPTPKNFPPAISLKGSKGILGTPPKTGVVGLAGAVTSVGSTMSMSAYQTDMSASQHKVAAGSAPTDPPAPLMQRSRSGSGSSKGAYVPPKGKYSGDTDQQHRPWMDWDDSELQKRKRALIGKTVVGKLSPQRGNRYFVKWNINANDTIVISADKVEEVLGDSAPAGMWVSCTIVGLGPGHVQWNKQHPYAMTLESRETRASHQPKKGKMARGSSHWKKSQKAGLSKPVVNAVSSRQTVPAEIDMARYIAGRRPVPTVPETLPSPFS